LTKRKVIRAITPWAFLALPLGLLVLLTYLPAANLIRYSFTSWDGIGPDQDWVGLANYQRMATDPSLYRVLLVSGFYLAGAFIQMAIALYFATILSFKVRFKNFFKGVLLFPYLLNGVAIGFVFLYFFKPGGTLDVTLAFLGIHDPPLWLDEPGLVNACLSGVSVWRFTGLNFVLFLGAIQSIPGDLYEAASLDGANSWHRFWYIILPGIRRVVTLSFILAISGALSVFEIPFVMQGYAVRSKTFAIQAVEKAFVNHKVGLAATMSIVLLALVLLVTWLQRRFFPDERIDLA